MTPAQRHALRVVCELGVVTTVRRSADVPVRGLIARGLLHRTARGIEPTDAGWSAAERMRPPVVRR